MKFLKKLSCAAAVTFAFASAANAGVVLNNWVFNPVGTGFSSGQTINEYLDVNGNAFIQLNPTGGSSFSFTEHAAFNIVQADGNGNLFPVTYNGGNITATFEAFGTGNFSGAFTFGGGTIKMYQNPTNGQYSTTNGMYGADLGNQIATFDVLAGGGGNVDASGSPVNNGQVTVLAKASAPNGLDAGYFFRSNGQDLSMEDVLAFAFTNANTVGQPTSTMVSEIACQFSGYCAADAGTNTTGHFFVSNNGQFKLAEVPEPGSLALFGIAMLGAGVTLRKRGTKA